MAVLKWIAVVLCVVQGSYMLIDGTRALVTGSYITPSSGDHTGQLGPWARLVARVGINPESVGMKSTFVVLGLAWLAAAVGLAFEATWSWTAALIVAIASVWYLVPGTVISVITLVLLVATPLRSIGRS
ncbi:hypothetical protein LWC34_43410 [Kibdelosporangium philippinense]|uniref:Uncharacterized protein n=1 Tax=Kibdelosporangium philippinense TaxID=211113 RepID=A0ABS8ZUV5_9PSEU|nr:hypothetical protein [Kibdelosporangium philippinense]MCE7009612.1 hypothetical protein [Kibdelosporangium philippinense]